MKFATEFHNIFLISYNSVYEEGQGKKLKELLGKKKNWKRNYRKMEGSIVLLGCMYIGDARIRNRK
jgi:hypothetical protein